MALEDLLASLREDAESQRSLVLSQAEAEARRIRGDAKQAVVDRRRSLAQDVAKEAEVKAWRSVTRARREARESVLEARARFLQRLEDRLVSLLSEADGVGAYTRVLPGELAVALDRLPAGPVELAASPDLAEMIEREVAASVRQVAVRTSPTVGTGFVATSVEAGTEVDARLKARLDHAWPRIAAEAARTVAP